MADCPRVTHPCATLLGAEAPFAFDLHVLSTPPAFNLSQNQTLQFKFCTRFSPLRAKIGISKISFPLAIHLSMNHRAFRPRRTFSVGARSVYAPLRFRSQPFFSLPAKFLFCLCFKNRPSSRNRNVAGRPPFVNTLRPKSFTFVAKGYLKRLSLQDLFFYPLLVVKRAA